MPRRKPDFWCHYCRRTLLPSTAKSLLAMTRDHVIPKSQGGTKTVPCCVLCNTLKSNLSIGTWRRFMLAFPDYWRHFRTHGEVRRAIRTADERIFDDGRSEHA